jgi:hypothetical protein
MAKKTKVIPSCENCIHFVAGAKDNRGQQCGTCKNGGPDGPETKSSRPAVTFIVAADIKECRGWAPNG